MSATLIENEDEPPTLLSLPNLAIELILEMTIDSINNVGEALRTLGSVSMQDSSFCLLHVAILSVTPSSS